MAHTPPDSDTKSPVVSVIVPAYNAASTLEATLLSICAQTLNDFEVIVVDDGSTDATPDITAAFAQRDARIRIVSKPNSGVADARNVAIHQARAPLIAPIDADDIWHPTYLEKLSRALSDAGERAVFAYANFRIIDMNGDVLGSAPSYDMSGQVVNRLMIVNFVGNGSGMMFRRDVALELGAYERRLQHEFGAQGCEDWLLQSCLANRGDVVAVPEYLVGYRSVPGAMSKNASRMARSRLHAVEILFQEVSCQHTGAKSLASALIHTSCFRSEFHAANLGASLKHLIVAIGNDPIGTCEALSEILVSRISGVARRLRRSLLPTRPTRRHSFEEFAPWEARKSMRNIFAGARLRRAARWDADSAPLAP